MSRGFSDQEYADWPRISILNTRRRIMAYLGVIFHIGQGGEHTRVGLRGGGSSGAGGGRSGGRESGQVTSGVTQHHQVMLG